MRDVLIVGAGPAGSVAGAVLARAGARVTILDRAASFPRDKLCGDTVNPGALAMLDRLGLADAVSSRGLPVGGMLLTGNGVSIEGRYPAGMTGRAIVRRDLDRLLLQQAMDAGAAFEPSVSVQHASVDAVAAPIVTGVSAEVSGHERAFPARVVIAADGRRSRIVFGLGAASHPRRPRRWAIGAYFENVAVSSLGEMHVREGHYIGVAPVPGGLTNACLVVPMEPGRSGMRDPARLLAEHLASDLLLRDRFADARQVSPAAVLGPLAVDVVDPAMPGLLLAGDAAGFVDPMTGDGLRFAIRGGELAAHAALEALEHGWSGVHARLDRARRLEFSRKWRFNRALRALVASPAAVRFGGMVASAVPAILRRAIEFAGDCGLQEERLRLCEREDTESEREHQRKYAMGVGPHRH
jgi:flavin-dependent dehydrogenase